MKLIKTASGKETIKISKADWQDIGKKAGWLKSASSGEIYMLDKGILYDDEGDEVFNMKKLIKYFEPMKELGLKQIPKFKNPEEANAFLGRIEEVTGDSLGRVEDADLIKRLRYKDTRKEKEQASQEYDSQRRKNPLDSITKLI